MSGSRLRSRYSQKGRKREKSKWTRKNKYITRAHNKRINNGNYPASRRLRTFDTANYKDESVREMYLHDVSKRIYMWNLRVFPARIFARMHGRDL